jgi:hypothetical protein
VGERRGSLALYLLSFFAYGVSHGPFAREFFGSASQRLSFYTEACFFCDLMPRCFFGLCPRRSFGLQLHFFFDFASRFFRSSKSRLLLRQAIVVDTMPRSSFSFSL